MFERQFAGLKTYPPTARLVRTQIHPPICRPVELNAHRQNLLARGAGKFCHWVSRFWSEGSVWGSVRGFGPADFVRPLSLARRSSIYQHTESISGLLSSLTHYPVRQSVRTSTDHTIYACSNAIRPSILVPISLPVHQLVWLLYARSAGNMADRRTSARTLKAFQKSTDNIVGPKVDCIRGILYQANSTSGNSAWEYWQEEIGWQWASKIYKQQML